MQDVKIFDTTLRDGQQGKGISFTVEDKVKITKLLDENGISYIEGGWPGASPKVEEFFKTIKNTLPERPAPQARFFPHHLKCIFFPKTRTLKIWQR